jgi:hypothetical protein
MTRRSSQIIVCLLLGAVTAQSAVAHLTSAAVGFTLGAGRSLAEVGEKCEIDYRVDIGATNKTVSLHRQCPAEERDLDSVRYPDDFGAVHAGPGKYVWHILVNDKEVESGEVVFGRSVHSK